MSETKIKAKKDKKIASGDFLLVLILSGVGQLVVWRYNKTIFKIT
jgi:hypothetical protein